MSLRPLCFLLIFCAGCEAEKTPAPQALQPNTSAKEEVALQAKAIHQVHPAWPVALGFIAAAENDATQLQTAIQELLDRADSQALDKAQKHWRDAAAHVEKFQVFIRLGQVAPNSFPQLAQLQFNLAAWPIHPGYLDAFGANPYSGLVFDVGMALSAKTLREQHGMTHDRDVALGLYAMEFLLFGEENGRGPLVFKPITQLSEELKADGYQTLAELPRNRRRDLLRLQAQLLLEDLANLKRECTGNHVTSVQSTLEALTLKQQTELLQKATLALVAEQLTNLALDPKTEPMLPPPTSLWQNQQLADRLLAQLEGLHALYQTLTPNEAVNTALGTVAVQYQTILKLPPLNDKGLPPSVNWEDARQALLGLMKEMNQNR
jgi:putative iron-regulated protein